MAAITLELRRRMMHTTQKPLRVLFLLQRPEAWGNVASIWRAMKKNSAFAPVAWLLPYNAENRALSALRLPAHRALLASQGVPWLEWSDGMLLEHGQFDIAFFTHPYDRERPHALWFDRVRSRVPKTVYVPYGLSVGAGAKNLRLQFAQPLQIGVDLIIARSFAEKSMYAKYCPAGDARVQVLGHPRFDRLLESIKTLDVSALQARIGKRIAILWNSHFSFGHRFSQSSNFSTFDVLGPELLDYLVDQRQSLCLLWRPHPGLFPELLRQGLLMEAQLPVLRIELDKLGIVLDEQADHLPAFVCSHAMVSDPGSFLFEYLATGKPFLPLINPEGEPLNEEASSLVAACGAASDFERVQHFIVAVANGNIPYERYAALRDQHLPMLDGNAGVRICAALLEEEIKTTEEVVCGYSLRGNAWNLPSVSKQPSAPLTTIRMPPVLAQLQAELRKIRHEKALESSLRKWTRAKLNRGRTAVGEHIKKMPWLMALLGRMHSR